MSQGMRPASLLVVGMLFVSCAQAQEIGRLFFTPEQRAALDARRRARVPDKPAAAPVAASPTTRLDGYVRRSAGPSTVWVNGATLEGASPGGDARVSVPVGDSGARVRLRPGETLDRSTGEVRDVLGGSGEVQVSPPR
jgi:hypothetical protein